MRYRRVRIEGATYFFTLVTHQRRPLFRDPQLVALLDEAIGKVRAWHPFEIDAQVILPDHLHAIWTLPDGEANYSKRWRLIKEMFTRTYMKHRGPTEPLGVGRDKGVPAVWQRRFWEHLIRDERDFAAHLDYIHLNPVQHGFVTAPCDWPHSTFQQWMARGVYEPAWGSDAKPELPAWAKRHE
jgi:putative transposase